MSGEPVLLIGIPSEPPLALAAAALRRLDVPHLVLNQRRFASVEAGYSIAGGAVTGVLAVDGVELPLEGFGGVYTRMMGFAELPEVRDAAAGDPLAEHADRLGRVLTEWLEVTPARVANRGRTQGSNASKPYQAQLITPYFDVPDTLVTNDPGQAQAFLAEHGRVVFKSISGMRSIVREFAPEDAARLDRLPLCPVQFQRYVEGVDIRVHTVGAAGVFATEISSEAADYRYAHRDGGDVALAACELEADAAQRCLALAAALGLEFAGIDLRRTPDGRLVCFEVNPSPAFSYYEEHAGQPIAEALAAHLAGLA